MARYRKRRFYRKKNKWSIEQRPGFIAGNGWATTSDQFINRQALIPIVSATTQEGVRKVKNFTISITTPLYTATGVSEGTVNQYNNVFYYALIYLPEGITANELSSTGDLYRPSQNVMKAGIVNSQNGKIRVFSRLARNLNAGDSIYLLIGTNANMLGTIPTDDSRRRFNVLTQYAICYN